MRIVILRHGEAKDDKLTRLGKKQVKLILPQLSRFQFSRIISSGNNRAKQTADMISKHFKMKYSVDERLNERWQLGHRPTNQDEQLWWDNYMKKDFSSILPDDFDTFFARTKTAFEDIIDHATGKDDVLIVAHSVTTYAFSYFHAHMSEPCWHSIGNANYICFEIKRGENL